MMVAQWGDHGPIDDWPTVYCLEALQYDEDSIAFQSRFQQEYGKLADAHAKAQARK